MQGSQQHFQEALRHSNAIREETIAMWEEMKGAAEHLRARIDWQGKMDRCPWATVATAAAIGYVLGGGLFTRFTAKIMKVSSRLVLMPMLRNKVMYWVYHASAEEPSRVENYSM